MPEINEFMSQEASNGKQLSLGIDNEGRMYVNGEMVITEQKVSLGWWINIAVVLGGLGGFAQGIIAIYSLYK